MSAEEDKLDSGSGGADGSLRTNKSAQQTNRDERQIYRYARQIALPQVGLEGQEKLGAAKVLIVGLGGLGAPVAMYLAAAGVGRLIICDGDAVDESNLQRQILFGEDNVGQAKVKAAATTLERLNSRIELETIGTFIDANNVDKIVSGCDVVVDCTDNLPVRYLLNDACLAYGKPLVYGALHRFEGQVSVFCLPDGPCFRCYFPDQSSADNALTCQEAGVFGVLPGIVGSLQASEVLKLILRLSSSFGPMGCGDKGQILMFDALSMSFDKLTLKRRTDCPCHKNAQSPRLPNNAPLSKALSNALSSNFALSDVSRAEAIISVEELHQALSQGQALTMLDVRKNEEFQAMRFCNCLHLPLKILREFDQEKPAGALPGQDNLDHPIVVYCRSGVTSRQAVNILRQRGYSKVMNLTGGIMEWYRHYQDEFLESNVKN